MTEEVTVIDAAKVDLSKPVLSDAEWDAVMAVCSPHPEESANTPWPLRAQFPLGKDYALGIVVKNRERRTKAGLVIPDTHTHQDKPFAIRVLKLSEVIDEKEFPYFAALKAQWGTGLIKDGPFVLYRQGSAYEWDFPAGDDPQTWAIVNLKSCIMAYEPTLISYDGSAEQSKGIEDHYNFDVTDPKPALPSTVVMH